MLPGFVLAWQTGLSLRAALYFWLHLLNLPAYLLQLSAGWL